MNVFDSDEFILDDERRNIVRTKEIFSFEDGNLYAGKLIDCNVDEIKISETRRVVNDISF